MKRILFYIRSLRFRIFLVILIVGIAPSFVLRAGLLHSYNDRAIDTRTVDVTSQAKLLASQIVSSDYLESMNNPTITTQLEQLATIYDGRVILVDNTFEIVKDTYHLDENKLIITSDIMKAHSGETVQSLDEDSNYITITLPLTEKDGENVLGVMLLNVSTDSIALNISYMRQISTIIVFMVIVLLVMLGIGISGFMTSPLRKLTNSISDVKDGYEKDFRPVETYSETKVISDACDDMLGRLQRLDTVRQEFVSNVSHELKTPLASMKVLADSLNTMDDAPVELYKEFMMDIGDEIDRENQIISDLLSLVKMDKHSGTLNVNSININDLLELLMKRLKPIAESQNVDLVLESFRPVTAEVDEVKLTLALSNLIENAIKYNKPEGWVHVTLNADHQNFFVTVEDNGIGIPESSIEHIFERFYRVDKSHSREIGGTGLGLAITKNIIILHRGAVKVHSQEGEGTTFTVRIPLHYIVNGEN